MEKELDPEIIRSTQSLLGKYVKRPPLTEKLLKKPPFRFLHDVITTILKTTGFFEGLFEDNELVSENVKDRDSKILFLNKVISVVSLTTGKALSVKPSKIVAGQEADKTNELLQCLAHALDDKLSSKEAVAKLKDTRAPQNSEPKAKQPIKSVKKSNEPKNLTSKSSEKLKSDPQKNAPRERSISKKEKEKVNDKKQTKNENSSIKNESLNKNTQKSKSVTKKNPVENKPAMNEMHQPLHEQNTVDKNNYTDKSQKAEITHNTHDRGNVNDREVPLRDEMEHISNTDQTTPEKKYNEQGELNTSYTICENDLNSSLSSQELIEVENGKTNNIIPVPEDAKEAIGVINKQKADDKDIKESDHNEILNKTSKAGAIFSGNADVIQENPEDPIKYNTIENPDSGEKIGHKPSIVRPLSVRPSSSRPGAPRPREKLDNIISETDNILLGKVNIIVEQEQNEEDEDTSLVIVERNEDTLISSDQHDHNQLSSSEHGHLVQQILDSQKELQQVTGKTEIEWQFGAQKAKEAQYQEIEQLRFNIQALSRVANPLGKLLDHIQEDVEVMRQELQQWTNIYNEVSKETLKQKAVNEDSLLPLHSKIKQLEIELQEKHEKINDLKQMIYKNSTRIEKLLASGNVQ